MICADGLIVLSLDFPLDSISDEQGVTDSSAGDTTLEDIQIDRAKSEICDGKSRHQFRNFFRYLSPIL